ncbi:hypothetical protein QC820_08275 [Halomonas mongoliensis]|uniref:Uncharacterized protein n=1 Tax=Halomonas mongoliensis TaxID=321265 RepID=A0ABU1GMY8_9GAMM|nr:hypothetical protein [Halomonas mongoliensis]MDR5892813.1 hypothetical protein [Halomonas mongoliensis]
MSSSVLLEMFGLFGGGVVIVTALSRWWGGVLSKRIIQNEKAEIDKKLEAEKAKLLEGVEVTKARLQEQTKLAEIRLSSINEERFKALTLNYQLLADTWIDCRWAIQPDELGRSKPPEKERLEKAAESLDHYFRDFERKRLFMSEESQSSVYEFLTSVWQSLDKLRIFGQSDRPFNERLNELYDEWIHDLKPKMDSARKAIESEYKEIIGVNQHNKALQRTSR